MTPKQILDLVKAIIDVVERDLIDPVTGKLTVNNTAKDIQTAADIEAALKAAGVAIPANIDRIISVLPLVAGLFGVK